MKVLFIGATGNVGSRVVPYLRGEFEVVGAALGGGESGGEPVAPLNIADFENTLSVVAEHQPDAIVNCAIADYRKRNREIDPDVMHEYHESTIEVNVRGAYHVYEAAFRLGVPKVVFVSSLTAVTGQPRYDSLSGDDPPRPADLYACTKLFGEQLGHVYVYRHGLSVTCLRLGQPCPMRPKSEAMWFRDPLAQGKMVHFDDIGLSIRGALRQTEGFHTYSIVSDSDHPWVIPTAIPDLDYEPSHHFTAEGIRPRK